MKVLLYDTTLRDGSQREGISYSLDDKLKIAKRLDEFGIDYIEGGWPGSNPKDVEFFDTVGSLNLKHAKIAAFGSTRRKGTPPELDGNIKALLDANTPVCTLVGKSWDLHVKDVLATTMEENLAMIGDSVAYLKEKGKEVIYDAEHFFDGYQANPEYALATVKTAAISGADCVVLCDTNGGSLPWEIEEIVTVVSASLGETPIGIHTHNDNGCGVANSLAAIKAGANHVQGTINGYGERVANANLCTVIPDLQLKMGHDCVTPEQLETLTELSVYVAEIANLSHDDHAPYVGASAFAHKGGIHVAAMLRNPLSYQHIDPEVVGNKQRSVVSELSGRGNLVEKAEQFGLDTQRLDLRGVLDRIKELESQGFTFEGAEASVDLMLRRTDPDYVAPFELVDFMVMVQRRHGRGLIAEATVKVKVGEQVLHTAAEGNGPVNALDAALRKSLINIYPQLADVSLIDYKVRILDGENATGATTRVLIDSHCDTRTWSTVGASANIIEASWRALADSMEYAIVSL
ncbi:MAG: citramalate synthase [Chloroflexota bacterium]